MHPPFAPDAMIRQLAWPTEPVDMVLDTDTYNEIDDQFALVYALLSPERLNVKAIYAAPFHNERSTGPADGMEKSYEEILRLLDFMNVPADGLAYRGSTEWLPDKETPVMSEAVEHLIELARTYSPEHPLYVVGIGAITNVAAALIAAPDIARNIVVVWLGGHPVHCASTREFNLQGDRLASRVLFDCGAPLVRFPCALVAQTLASTSAEMERFAKGRGKVGDYLYEIFSTYHPNMDKPGVSKVIWDLAPVAWLVQEAGISSHLIPSPILNIEDLTFSVDPGRHFMREAVHISRDVVYKDLFTKLAKLS